MRGLFVGAHGRIVWSMLFTSIGLATFEVLKGALDCNEAAPALVNVNRTQSDL